MTVQDARFAARIPDNVYNRLRVLAAINNKSINAMLCDIISDYIKNWEQEHGTIPTLNQ